MASLQDSSLEEEQFTAAIQAQGLRHSAAATALPLSHGAARKWFYKDPQGEIQGAQGGGVGRAQGQYHPCHGLLWCTSLTVAALPLAQAPSRPRRWQSGSRRAISLWPYW